MSVSVSWGCSASQPKDNCPPIPSASPNMQPGLEFKGSICRCHVKTLLFTYLLLWSYVDTQPQLSRGPQGDQPSQKVKQKYTNHNCFKPYRVCGSCSTNKTPCHILLSAWQILLKAQQENWMPTSYCRVSWWPWHGHVSGSSPVLALLLYTQISTPTSTAKPTAHRAEFATAGNPLSLSLCMTVVPSGDRPLPNHKQKQSCSAQCYRELWPAKVKSEDASVTVHFGLVFISAQSTPEGRKNQISSFPDPNAFLLLCYTTVITSVALQSLI